MASIVSSKTVSAQDLQNLSYTIDTWDDGTKTLRTTPQSVAAPTKTVVTATITSGQSASAAVDLGGSSICGLICPAALTGTSLSIQGASTSGGTYTTLKDILGNAATFSFTANQAYYVDPIVTAGFQYIKILSTTNEGADRAVTLLTRPV